MGRKWFFGFAFCIAFLSHISATAQDFDSAPAMRPVTNQPDDCLVHLNRNSSTGVYNWTDLVWVEHCDRIKRLQRISERLPANQQPQFFDGTVLASDLPNNIPVDVPILRVVFPDRSFFDTDESVVKPGAIEVARIIAESLRKELPDVVMFVAGHADARASRRYNEVLSINRANALAEQVLQFGTGDASVWRVGFGEDLPLVAGTSEFAYDQNRRIEFLFSARSEALAVWMSRAQKGELCQGRTRREIDVCKRGLTFNRPYEVVEITASPRTTNVRRPPSQTAVSSQTAGRNVATGNAPRQQVESSSGERREMILSRGRRISLDLSRGKVE